MNEDSYLDFFFLSWRDFAGVFWPPVHLRSLLSGKTSVPVSTAPARPWVCLTCQECASLTEAVTSMKTRAFLWLSPLPTSLDTGKGPRKPRSRHVHASRPDRGGNGKHLEQGIRGVRLHCGLGLTFPNLCFLVCAVGIITHFKESSVFSALTTCTICITGSGATAIL